MIKQYFKIAWRNLVKNRLFSFLNIIGLASGMAVALLLLLYVKDEKSFDRYNSKANRIYRMNLTATFDGKTQQWANVPNIAGPAMKKDIPAIEEQVRLLSHNYGQTAFVNTENKKFTEKKLFWADSTLFHVFDIPLLQGKPATALAHPNTIVINKSIADKYFETEDPIGKILKVDNKYNLEVTGVYKDLPANSTIDAEMFGAFSSVDWASKNLYWSNASYETYLLLSPSADTAKVNKQMAAVLDKNVAKDDRWFSFWLQPLTDIHLGSAEITNASTSRIGDAKHVKIITILAIVVLLIASINYMNLATAKSQLRFKEVGINKTVGARWIQLAGRFYVETILLVALSILLALAFVAVAIPLFNNLAEKQLSFTSLFSLTDAAFILMISIVVVIVAGSYPAFYLSAFKPKELLHTTFRKSSGAGLLRRSLVVVQFSATVVLIIAAIIFFEQLNYIQNKKLGYNPSQVIAVTTSGAENTDQINAFMNGLRSLSSVEDVCRAQTYPGFGGSGRTISRSDRPNDGMFIRTNHAGPDFVNVLGLKLLAGKTYKDEKEKDDTTVQVVLNKKAVEFLGYTPEEAIGKKAYNLFGWDRAEIVGVVEDFHFDSFHQPIGAYAFHNNNSEWRPYLLVKANTKNLPATLKQIQTAFQKYLPNSAFEYLFLDRFLQTLYKSEQRTANVVMLFSVLTIIIACLGLFGLAAFTAEQRTKEIGIRKVLGASVNNVVGLLSKDFLQLVLIASVISAPVAWYFMHKWLQNFAYRIDFNWWVFVSAALIALSIAWLTISFQAIKAGVTEPVKSLRTE